MDDYNGTLYSQAAGLKLAGLLYPLENLGAILALCLRTMGRVHFRRADADCKSRDQRHSVGPGTVPAGLQAAGDGRLGLQQHSVPAQ